ncbi:MAG: hypothetical protein KC417_11585, partial [Myxococcales bacterium]|nr:hypothetical protein [Myxococcales bacterium]
VRAGYLALVVNTLTLGWVNLAMVKILHTVLGVNELIALPVVLVIAVTYATASGLWGVVATDTMQFIVAMIGLVCLTYATMDAAGGPAGIQAALAAKGNYLDFIPPEDSATLPFFTFCVYISMQWWATRNADGGEYIGQRLLAARSVRDAQLGMVWYAFCEFALKLWPMVLTALASLVLIPHAADDQAVYPTLVANYLPNGLRGLMIASLLAAFMSTVDTQLNWGASYLVNDLYGRFIKKDMNDAQYLRASRIAMVGSAILGAIVSLGLSSVADAWKLLLALGAGQGLVVLLRWYWWRINAWSELSAMLASAIATMAFFRIFPDDKDYGYRLMGIVSVSSVVWIAVTFLTRPVGRDHLLRFYARAKPRGGAWGPIREALGGAKPEGVGRDVLAWFAGLVFVYGLTFGVGKLVLGDTSLGIGLSVAGAVALVALLKLIGEDREEDSAPDPTPEAAAE